MKRSTPCALTVAALAVSGLVACAPSPSSESTPVTPSVQTSTSGVIGVSITKREPVRPIVGEVPGQPAAAAALNRWAEDLFAGDMVALERNCWTIEPGRIRSMYADQSAILKAVGKPGIDGQFAYIWQDDTTRVSAKRSEVSSGYACPYISEKGDVHIFTGADAQYLVFRYLQRIVGQPVNVNDTEVDYPLECSGYDQLTDTSRSIAAGIASYDRASLVTTGGPDEWQVTVRAASASGEREYRFTTSGGPEGYCIADVR